MRSDAENTERGRNITYPTWFTAGLILTSITALLVRLYAARDNFWLDEIIPYFMAMNNVHALRDIFTGIPIEHHFLVTLEMWLAGDQLNWFWYRLPSVLSGTGIVIVTGVIAARRMRLFAALTVSAITALSFPLVVYSSEARGYAPAAFFSLLAFLCIDRWQTNCERTALAGYLLAIITAVLYHSTAVCVFLSLVLWSAIREFKQLRGLMTAVRNLVLCHGLVILTFGLLYVSVMRKWQTMGGDILPLAQVVRDTASLAMGLPAGTVLGTLILCVTVIITVISLWSIRTYLHSETWIFHISLLFIAPALMLLSSSRQYVYVRYFLVMFPFFYLMLGEGLDKLASIRPGFAFPASLMAICIIAGNVLLTVDFLRIGRGGYLDAVMCMADNTPWQNIIVSGDHDFRNETTIRFYSRYIPGNKRIIYLKQADWPAEGPDWSIIQSSCMEAYVPEQTVQAKGGTYRLVKSYPCSTLSGLNWHLYRNDTKFAGNLAGTVPQPTTVNSTHRSNSLR